MSRFRLLLAAAIVALGPLAVARSAIIGMETHAISITPLGQNVTPTAINDHGVVAGQNASGVAFRWENGSFTALGTLGGATSYANDINNDGVIIGWSLDESGLQKAFKYDGSALINVDAGTTTTSAALAISNEGDFVGWKSNGSVFHSSLWDVGSPNGGLIFGTLNSQATGINEDGKIVGITLDSSSGPNGGYYWNGTDPLTGVSNIIGTNYLPYAGINDNDLTGGQRGGVAHILAIGDSEAGGLGKLSPDDTFSKANALNNLNLIVGESDQKGFAFDTTTGTLYNLNDFAKLDPATFGGITILRLTGINDHNQFTGLYRDASGDTHGFTGAFVAIPEPGCYVVLVAVTGLLLRAGRRTE